MATDSVQESIRLRVAVGSKNPVKLSSVITGLNRAFKCDISPHAYNSPSGVPDQPIGDEETKLGALNRARNAFNSFTEEFSSRPNYSVGLEGGILITNGVMECFAWICIYTEEKQGFARTAAFALPKRIHDLVLSGMELGDADDAVFGSVNSKQSGGTVGHLTKGVIDRAEYYQHAVVLATIPFQYPDLY